MKLKKLNAVLGLLSILVMLMHMGNIKRIAKGEEKPLTIGGKDK